MRKDLGAMGLGLALALGAALTACGGDDGGGGLTDGPCTEAKSMCATLHVPDDYAKVPKKIIVGFYESLPASGPSGPPVGVGAIIENPTIGVGMPFELEAKDMMVEGEYFVYIALYDEGGGNFQPVPGIDYVGQTSQKVKVGDGPLNLGDVMLELAK